jgi:bleomycin hydrolase
MKFSSPLRIISAALIAVLLAAPSILAGQGGITPEMLGKMRESFKMDTHNRAMYNAITNTDINNLALNRDILRQQSDVFSHKVKTKGITNQKSSGRCWLFAGLNALRPAVIEKYKLSGFEFSQSFLAFWDKLEKSNCFLEYIVKFRDREQSDRELEILLRDPVGDGGWWKYVVDLVEKYGVVPKEIMPETNSSENTGSLNNLVNQKLRADAAQIRKMGKEGKSLGDIAAAKETMLAEIYKMLVINYGEPPSDFQYRFEDKDSIVSALRTYTPRTFYKEFVGVDLNQYLSIFNDPSKEFGKHYSVNLSRNIFDADDMHYANVEIEKMKEMAMKSVLADEPVWFACDVGIDQNRDRGIMATDLYDYGSIYNIDMSMSKADRIRYLETTSNHAMVLVGVDVKDDKPVKWLVENSWGSENKSAGYWTMYDNWFDENLFNIIIRKDFVPKEILKIYDQTPVVVPAWDPMFMIYHQ